jgi:hypothetical protein
VFLEDDGVGQREKCVGIEEWCVVAFELVVSELFHQWRNRWSLSWKTEDFQVISQGFIDADAVKIERKSKASSTLILFPLQM